MFAAWLTYLALAHGLSMALSGDTFALPLFFLMGYVALAAALVKSVRRWEDLLNPLAIIITLGLIRYTIPAIVLLWVPPESVFRYRLAGLHGPDFAFGHVLALTGLLGVSLGWQMVGDRRTEHRPLRVRDSDGIRTVARLGMVLGLLFLVLFVSNNVTDVAGALFGGTFRRTEIQEGTGIFKYLSLLLPASAILYAGYLIARERGRGLKGLLPPLLATGCLFILGGRSRAVVPILAAVLLLRYVRLAGRDWRQSYIRQVAFALLVALPTLFVFAYAGSTYRGSGVEGTREAFSLERTGSYLETTFLFDIGALHGLAAAGTLEPGVLGPGKFAYDLLWPASVVLGIQGRSSGLYIVEKTFGFSEDRRYGVHASLTGDAYLALGTLGVGVVTALFGVLVKLAYVRFRTGRMDGVLYVIIAVYGVRMFFTKIGGWADGITVLAFAILALRLAPAFEVGARSYQHRSSREWRDEQRHRTGAGPGPPNPPALKARGER